MQIGTVTVVGGGLAGIALATARAGWAVTLCEQAPAFQTSGAGLTVAPSASAGLRYLGVYEEFARVAEISAPPVLVDWESGLPLPHPSGDSSHLGTVRRILRKDLQAILAEALRRVTGCCTLRFDARLLSVEAREDGAVACFADGRQLESDLLLGADGIRSRVRAHVAGEDRPRFTGYGAWRFLLPMEVGAPILRGRKVLITAGIDASLTCYAIGGDRAVNCVAIVRADAWMEEGWTIPGEVAELARHFETAHADARAIIAAAPADRLYKWALFDRDPLPQWVRGRVALLGDAAHPVLPFLGLGAGLAIEDAVVLARALEVFPIEHALTAYVRTRAPRAAMIQQLSRAQGEAFARIGRERAVAPFFDRAIFDYDPVTVALG